MAVASQFTLLVSDRERNLVERKQEWRECNNVREGYKLFQQLPSGKKATSLPFHIYFSSGMARLKVDFTVLLTRFG